MKSKINKDIYNRIFFYKEMQLIIKEFISLPFQYKNICIFQKKIFFSQLRNRCVYSFKSRSVFSKFRASRIFFRHYALIGKINSVKKTILVIFLALMVELVDTVDSNFTAFISLLVQIQLRVKKFFF